MICGLESCLAQRNSEITILCYLNKKKSNQLLLLVCGVMIIIQCYKWNNNRNSSKAYKNRKQNKQN